MFNGDSRRSIRFRTALLILLAALVMPVILSGCGGVSDGSLGGDSPGIQLSPATPLQISENPENGNKGYFHVSLATSPNAEVFLDVTSTDENRVIIDQKTIKFDARNWDQPKPIQVIGIDNDDIEGNQKFQITVSVNLKETKDTTGYRRLESVSQEVTILDDDRAAVTVTPSDPLSISEGESAFFNVRLNSIPDGDVVVDISSGDPFEVTVDSSSPLTFTADTWDQAQRVYLSGVRDYDIDGDQEVQITLQINKEATTDTTGYQDLEAGIGTVKILDADTPGVSVTPTSLGTIPEVEGSATFKVRLTTIPDGDVVISVTSSDTDQAIVTPQSLTFTPEDWDTEQDVTVTGVNDQIADGNQSVVINLTIDQEGTTDTTGYEDVEILDVSVTVADDMAGVTVIPGTTTFSEDGSDGKGSFLVVLNSKPNGNVVLDIESQDTSEATVEDRRQLTFTSANWSTRQTVLLTPADDDLVDGNTSFKINLRINKDLTEDTTGYADLPDGTIAAVPVTVIDNDKAGVTIDPQALTLSEKDGPKSFGVRLNSQPNGTVVLRIESSDTSEATVDVTTLVFDEMNWNGEKSVTISGEDDSHIDGNQTVIIAIDVDPNETADTTGYTDLTASDIKNVTVTVTDDDVAKVTVSPTELPILENGSGEFTVVLNTIPNGTVVLDVISLGAPDEAVVDQKRLTFDHLNWSTPQKVLVSSVNNDIIDGSKNTTIVVNINAAGTTDTTGYLDVDPEDVEVSIDDDDTAGVSVEPTAITLQETGETKTFTVSLKAQPLGEVTLSILSGDENIATVNKAQLVFNGDNWQTPQDVSVSGVDDPAGSEDRTVTIQTAVQSAPDDLDYQELEVEDVAVTVTDVPPAL